MFQGKASKYVYQRTLRSRSHKYAVVLILFIKSTTSTYTHVSIYHRADIYFKTVTQHNLCFFEKENRKGTVDFAEGFNSIMHSTSIYA